MSSQSRLPYRRGRFEADHPVSTNCLGCHMLKQQTIQIVFDSKGKRARPQVRNHRIKVYGDET